MKAHPRERCIATDSASCSTLRSARFYLYLPVLEGSSPSSASGGSGGSLNFGKPARHDMEVTLHHREAHSCAERAPVNRAAAATK